MENTLAAPDEVDPRLILADLGLTRPDAIRPAPGGFDTSIWRVDLGDDSFALRVFRPNQQRAFRRETLALAAAAAGGVPVPRVHAATIWQERPVMLLAWCAGRPVAEELRARPWRAWWLGVICGRTQAAIHRVTLTDALRNDAVDWIGWAGRIDDALRARLSAVASRPDVLLHLDYHPNNVLTDGVRVTAVLDWTNSHVGDPRADVARSYTIVAVEPMPPGPVGLAELIIRRLFAAGCRRGYARVADPLVDMAPFYAWAGEVLLLNLLPSVGRPGRWWTANDFDSVRRWTGRCRQRAGLQADHT